MIETFGALAFMIAIILMCGPQACYNAGSWIGFILKAFWKVAVWAYRTIAKAVTQKQQAPALMPAPQENVIVADFRNDSFKEEKFEGNVIDGKATVL